MEKSKGKRIRRHLKIKPFLLLISSLLLIFLVGYYIYQLPIKNIYIKGTSYLRDYDVIVAAGIKDYPKMFKMSAKTIEKKVSKLDLVNKATVKKTLLGKLTITIEEATPLFYNRNKSSYVLSSGAETNAYAFSGVPFLINYVPEAIYSRLVKELSKINIDSLKMISEFEYSPSMSGEIVLDDTRFLLRMNDGNEVFINLIHLDRLDLYPQVYTVFTEKGRLQLDSDNENVFFKTFKSIEEEKKQKQEESE